MTTNTTTTITTITQMAEHLIAVGWGEWAVDPHQDTVGYWEAAASAEAEWVGELRDAIRHLAAGELRDAADALDTAYHTEAAYGGDDTMRVIRPLDSLIDGLDG